jgi:hypothetical protein
MEDVEKVQFASSAAVVSRLGAENITDPVQAVTELVKNSYDHDASSVTVEVRQTDGADKIVVWDDGEGMSREDIKTHWLPLGTEHKVCNPFSTAGRRRLGAKGIGRLSCQKLGRNTTLVTTCAKQPWMSRLTIDWDQFVAERNIDDVDMPLAREHKKQFQQGTEIVVHGLRDVWHRARVSKLRRALCNLVCPTGAEGFAILLKCDFEDLNGRMANEMPEKATHVLDFELGGAGVLAWTLTKAGCGAQRGEDQLDPPSFGPVRGTLWYNRGGWTKQEQARGDGEVHVGVKVYRDVFRVRPYGEQGDDWLGIKDRRASRGGHRLRPHCLMGAVHISGAGNPRLVDTTSRERMDENEEFQAFRALVVRLVRQLEKDVAAEEEQETEKRRDVNVRDVLDEIGEAAALLPSDKVAKEIEEVDKLRRQQVKIGVLDSRLDASGLVGARKTHEWSGEHMGKPAARRGDASRQKRPRSLFETDRETVRRGIGSRQFMLGGKALQIVASLDPAPADPEAAIELENRRVVVNMNHPFYVYADNLDRQIVETQGTVGPSLRIHCQKAFAVEWARWHRERGDDFEERYNEALDAIKLVCEAKPQPAVPPADDGDD